jgi:hypothetical protein
MVKKSRQLPTKYLKDDETPKPAKRALTNVGMPKSSKSGTKTHRKVLKKAFGG